METPTSNQRRWASLATVALLIVLGSGCLLIFSGIGLGGSVTPLHAADQQTAPPVEPPSATLGQITIVAADEQGLVLELEAGAPVLEQRLLHGEQFQQVTLPDSELSATPGAPQVPLYSTLLGVPVTTGLSVTIIEAAAETLADVRLAPAPRLVVEQRAEQAMSGGTLTEQFALEPAAYATDAFAPDPVVQLGDSGYMRDQAVIRVTFHPVQYNPVRRELRFYPRLRVRVQWDAQATAASAGPRGSSAAYESFLATTLLNYQTLGRSVIVPALSDARSQPAPAVAAAAAVARRLKIVVDHDGIYAITPTQLTQAGLDPTTFDPRTFHLSNEGQPVAIYVTGEEDGRFDPDDRLLFYGTGRHHDRYTTINVYWLTVDASVPGPRMALGTAVGGALPVAQPFRTVVHAEQDTVYWQNMLTPNAHEDRWFWEPRLSLATAGYPATRLYTVTLASLAPNPPTPPTLRVKLKGFTNANHLTQLYINDHAAGPAFTWTGQVEYTHTVPIEADWLKAGHNFVRVEVRPGATPPGGLPDEILVNWVEIEHSRTYRAADNTVHFAPPAAGELRFDLDGFTAPAITVLDVTDVRTPWRMATTPPVSTGAGWSVTLQTNAVTTQHYVAAGGQGYQTPHTLLLDEPSNLRVAPTGINYLLITHPDFYASAVTLAQYREAVSGLRTQIVKLDDIYDAFNDGIANPQAIRDYLTYAYTSTAPAPPDYVLLLGDATLDYHTNFPVKMPNFVPTQVMTSTLFGEVPSDNWFVMLAGNDPIPEMFIGRLVAQTPAEAATMVAKIMSYQPDATWNTKTLFVADDDESKFRTNSDELMQSLPHGYLTTTVYVTNTVPVTTYRNQIINTINDGVVLVNYFGHGEYFGWGLTPGLKAADYIFHKEDVARLTNRDRLPVVTIANCLNGAFAGAGNLPSLAEALQSAPNGGAVAVWAPASIGYPTGHRELIGNLYNAIFQNDRMQLGRAAAEAKARAFQRSPRWEELVQTYVLLGDPAMKIGVATTDPYVLSVNPPHRTAEIAVNQPVEVLFNKPMSVTTVGLTSNPPVAFTVSEVRDNRLFRFTHPPLTHLTRYTLTVQGRDLSGGDPLRTGPVPSQWSFTTERDVPPTAAIGLRTAIPTLAAPGDAIMITFSEPVRPTLEYVITPGVVGELILSADGRTARFEHENFSFGQTYSFTLRAAEDATGNRLSSSVTFTFTVGDLIFLPLAAR